MAETLQVEPTESAEFGPCECCGGTTRRVWGLVRSRAGAEAAHYVQWTIGQVPKHGALFDLIIGRWGDGATDADRVLVTLDYRLSDEGPEFMVIDSADRPAAASGLAGRALSREEVIGQPVAGRAFAIVDAVLAQDPRVVEVLGPYRMGPARRRSKWRFWR